LITSYARYRASLGALFHHVDWVAIPGLPTPPEIYRRRIVSFKHELEVRKALMNICTLLATRYAKHLQQLKREQALDNDNVGISKGLVKSLVEKSCL
jgi:general transcription factor 3C polypeptide 1